MRVLSSKATRRLHSQHHELVSKLKRDYPKGLLIYFDSEFVVSHLCSCLLMIGRLIFDILIQMECTNRM